MLNIVFREHSLNDKTTAQARVQMQIVTQLEVQLKKEKVRVLVLPVMMMVVVLRMIMMAKRCGGLGCVYHFQIMVIACAMHRRTVHVI